MKALKSRISRSVSRVLRRRGIRLKRLSDAERRYLATPYQPDTPAAPDADTVLRPDNPELLDLARRYAPINDRLGRSPYWAGDSTYRNVYLRQFRGDTLYIWHYREALDVTRMKYYIYLQYLRARDPLGLIERLGEDGAFGCWTFDFAGLPSASRDLLDSVNEIYFLERQLALLQRPELRVLDIGAGYGRLAHRFSQVHPSLADYCCVDAIPESTFLARYYLGYRGCSPPARVAALDTLAQSLQPGDFDIAFNVHSFSECTREAIGWWLEELRRLRIPQLFIVPNDGASIYSLETDGTRVDCRDLLERAGYREIAREMVIDDPAARELLGIDDVFLLFRLEGSDA